MAHGVVSICSFIYATKLWPGSVNDMFFLVTNRSCEKKQPLVFRIVLKIQRKIQDRPCLASLFPRESSEKFTIHHPTTGQLRKTSWTIVEHRQILATCAARGPDWQLTVCLWMKWAKGGERKWMEESRTERRLQIVRKGYSSTASEFASWATCCIAARHVGMRDRPTAKFVVLRSSWRSTPVCSSLRQIAIRTIYRPCTFETSVYMWQVTRPLEARRQDFSNGAKGKQLFGPKTHRIFFSKMTYIVVHFWHC